MAESKPKSEKQIAAWAAFNATRHPHPAYPYGEDAGIKHCRNCCEEKPADEFPRNKRNSDGRHSHCRKCIAAYNREYRKGPGGDRERARERAELAERQAKLSALKDVPCTDCGGRFPSYCMDFDHVRGVKVTHVSKLIRQAPSWERILDEVAKCEVVCANCHRIRTFTRGQYAGQQPLAEVA